MSAQAVTTLERINYSQSANLPQPETSTFQGRRVQKIHYPEFGEKTAMAESTWKKVLKISLIVIGVLTAPAGIGILLLFAAYQIDTKVAPANPPKRPNNKEIGLGTYHKANLRLTATSDEGFYWKKQLIASAQESIEISANYAGGLHFRQTLQLIKEQMEKKEHLKTHLIVSSDLLESSDKEALKQLKSQFGERFHLLITEKGITIDIPTHASENHVKMVIVDGKYFVSGGTGLHSRLCQESYDKESDREKPNFASQLLDRTSRDSDIVAESPSLANAMRRQFFNLYKIHEKGTQIRFFALTGPAGTCAAFHEKEGLFEGAKVKFLVAGPEHSGSNAITLTYAKRILKAKEKIRFANWMLSPAYEIKQALVEAKAENPAKKIKMLSNGLPGTIFTGRLPIVLVNRGSYHLADTAYEFQTATNFHHKVALFDETHMIIGSYNLSKKSAEYDHEVAFVIKDARIAKRGVEAFKSDAKRSSKYPKEKIERNKMVNLLGAKIAGVIEYFL